MSYLAVQLEDYFVTHPEITMIKLEASAGLKRGTIDSIRRDAHPRPERFGQLLHAVDDDTARKWLTAYLLDDCPPEFLPRLEITITALQSADPATLREAITAYTHGQLDTSPAAVLKAWHRLQSAIQADTSLAKWFIKITAHGKKRLE
jgi:hypothetical protein